MCVRKKNKIKVKKLPAVLTCPTNDDQLWDYIKNTYDIRVPRIAAEEGHTPPFDFMADLFFERVRNVLAIGSRGSGKTHGVAIVHALNSIFKKKCLTGTVGSTKAQASECYRHFQSAIEPYYEHGKIISSFATKTIFADPPGSMVVILSGTIKGVNSPHPQKAFLDEFELASWDVFQEFLNMPMSKFDVKAQVVLISSRKYPYGNVEKILKTREEMGFKLYLWNIWDVAEQCKDRLCSECEKYVKGVDKNHKPRTFRSVCNGKMKNSRGFAKFDDILSDFRTQDILVWESQKESRKALRTGAVFYWFDGAEHCRDFEINVFDKETTIYETLDYGGGDPNVCLWWAETRGVFRLFDEIYIRNLAPSDFADMIKERRRHWGLYTLDGRCTVKDTFCDPSGKISRLELEKHGINTIGAKNSILEGIDVINSVGTDGNRILIHNRCEESIREFRAYSYPKNGRGNKPTDRDNHVPDATRYLFLELDPVEFDYSKGGAVRGDTILTPSNSVDKNDSFSSLSPRHLFGIDVSRDRGGGHSVFGGAINTRW